MVNKAVRTALERLWKDRCSIFIREEVTDPVTHLTDSEEKPLLQDQPCKLSFETLTSTNGDEVATAQQVVKLFLSPDVKVSRRMQDHCHPAKRCGTNLHLFPFR